MRPHHGKEEQLCALQHQPVVPLQHWQHPRVLCPDVQSAWAAKGLALQDAPRPKLARHSRYLAAKILHPLPHFRDQHLEEADRDRTASMEEFLLRADI